MLCEIIDWSGGWATTRGSANRGTKAKTITSCDNAFVTNIVLAQAAHRTPPRSFALCESEATANVLSVRKRSDSNNKAPSLNGNQPLILQKNHTLFNCSLQKTQKAFGMSTSQMLFIMLYKIQFT